MADRRGAMFRHVANEGAGRVAHHGRMQLAPVIVQDGDLLVALGRTQAAMFGAVLDGAGLGRIAELAAAAVRGPVAAVVPQLGTALAGGDDCPGFELASLERWLRAGASRSSLPPPAGVVSEACVEVRGEVVGVVAMLGAPSPPPSRREAREFLRLAAAAVMTQLAIADATETLQQKLRGSFLEELRERDDLGAAEVVRRALRLGCDLSFGAAILCVELTVDRPRHVLAIIAGEHPGALAQVLDGGTSPARRRIYAILPATTGSLPPAAASCRALAKRLVARLEAYGAVATSSFQRDPGALRLAVREAELALEVARHSGVLVTDEIGNGTYKLLFRMLASDPRAVHDFYEDTLHPMVRYDDQNRTELVATLQAYLSSNCNMNATAAAVFAHRHTIAARLERIRELTGLDPTVCGDREQLGLGLKAHRLLAPHMRAPAARWDRPA